MAIDKKQADEIQKQKTFNINDLKPEDQENFKFVQNRILELKETRKNVYGTNLEEIWAEADKAYIPHTLGKKGKKVAYLDDEKGWRGTPTVVDETDNWQYDGSRPNPYIKIQTALGILVDRNPTGVFLPASSKFEKTNALMKSLYIKSWEESKSKQQLKLFIYNLAKYGWAVARTFAFNNKVCRENLDPWNSWIDDMAKPSNPYSLRDWCWRKVYSWDMAKQEFGDSPYWKYVKPGGNTDQMTERGEQKKFQEKNLIEVFFYENRIKDLLEVHAGGVPVKIEKLPIEKSSGEKKLSVWQTYWTIRHGESPYGIGIYEAMRSDQKGLDRIRNMTIDQLTMAIYKPGFYQGTNSLQEEGTFKIKPGVMKQVMDAKNINWMTIPGPGQEAWSGIEMFQADVDKDSGITDPLIGDVTGKTAFEVAQAKEAALKRLKVPLDNITDALDEDGYLTLELVEMLYSVPEIIEITDPNLIKDYLEEIKSDPELFTEITDTMGQRTGIQAKIYPEVQLGLEQDKNGNYAESQQSTFYRLKPKALEWEGVINIDAQSILVPSVELSKALDLEMLNLLGPLMSNTTMEFQQSMGMQQSMTLDDTTYGKMIKNVLKIYNKTPEEWLPNPWLKGFDVQEQPLIQQAPQPQIGPDGQPIQEQPGIPPQGPQAPQPNQIGQGAVTLPQRPSSLASRVSSQFANKLTGRR